MNLYTILKTHYEPAGVMGRASSAPLERDLQRYAHLNVVIYSLLLGLMIAILLAVAWVIAIDLRAGQLTKTTLLAGAGVTAPLVLELVRRTVREWSQTTLVAALSRKLEGAELQAVLEALIESGSRTSAASVSQRSR